MKTVAVSGGFDPIHPGHIRMFKEAAKLGKLVVILNNDNWLRAKKGYVFMPQMDRDEVIASLACVDRVFLSTHDPAPQDMSVSWELKTLRPDIFVNAGDRSEKNTPEMDTCELYDIEMVFNATKDTPYDRHSSELIKRAAEAIIRKS